MHYKVQELRELSKWSDGHVWISPEQHGNLVSPTRKNRRVWRLHAELTMILPRLASSSSRSTGFHSPRARSDLPRAAR